MKRYSPALAVVTLILVGATARAGAQEVRAWTDKTTGKKIEASMVSADPKARTVTIQKDGQSFTLPVDRLVDADLAYIKAHLNAPAAPAPTAAATPATPAKPGAPAPAPVAAAPAAPVGAPAPAKPVVVVVPAKKFKHPAGNAIMGAVKRVHPRLLMNAEGFAGLKGRVETDPTSILLVTNISKTVEQLLALPELTKVYGAEDAAAAPGREALFRLSHLGMLNYVKPDPRYPDRGVKELLAVCKDFTNWNPDKPDICAEFVWGIALGFDWFHAALNKDQTKVVTNALMELGMDALMAHLKKEPLPPTTKRAEAGQVKTAAPKAPAKAPAKKKDDKDEPVSTDDMKAAAALLLAAIAISDDEPNAAGPAATLAAKVFGKGMEQFAPDGIWPETIAQGDEVLDIVASVLMTFRAACGSDFGFTTIEGLPGAGVARMALSGPTGLFNYGDSKGGFLTRTWVTSWLAAMYGNPGVPALKVPAAKAPQKAGLLDQVGLLLYNSPHITGYGTAEALDYAFNGAHVATLRSAWGDPKAYFVGVKGGSNEQPSAQLDLGTFVLDAGGIRWAIDLGAEGDRVAGMTKPNDPARFKLYREGTLGQNVVRFGDEQATDAKAEITGFFTSPERGVAIVDLKGASASKAKEYHRGVMISRGAKPYVLLQDEMHMKTAASPEWVMHTKAEVTVDGAKATLKSGASLLTVTLLSPKDAKFTTEALSDDDKKLRPNDQVGSFKGISLLKVALGSVKGEQTIAVSFASGSEPAAATLLPLEQWVPKKR